MNETLDAYIISLMLHKQTFQKRAISGVLHSSISDSTNHSHLFSSLIKIYGFAARNESAPQPSLFPQDLPDYPQEPLALSE